MALLIKRKYAVTGNSALLFDTNAFIYFFTGRKKIKDLVEKTPIIYYSPISKIELLSASHLTDENMAHINSFLSMCELIPLNAEIVNETISIRRQYNVKIPDAIIAASAKQLNVPLVSADTDFQKIKHLTLITDILT